MTREECIERLQEIVDQDKSKILVRVHAGYLIHAIKYLKEQEPVKPIVEQYALPLTNTSVRFIKKHYCGICKEEVTGNNVYCHKCGRKVKWDG